MKLRPLRLVLLEVAVAVALPLLVPHRAWAQEDKIVKVSGRVYNQATNRGVSGVPVTNGLRFVLTGEDGSYEIEVGNDPSLTQGGTASIAISCPSGRRCVTPWFRNVDDLSPGEKVDFSLKSERQTLPFTFIHATDSHVSRLMKYGRGQMIAFRKDMEAIGDKAAFCMMTGDEITYAECQWHDAVSKDYASFCELAADFPIPLYCTPGNHDLAGIAQHVKEKWKKEHPKLHGLGLYTRSIGPLRWSFNHAGIHFVGVDWMQYDEERDDWTYTVPSAAVKWLEEDLKLLKPGTRICIGVHHPTAPPRFWGLLKEHKVEQMFAGHTHRSAGPSFSSGPSPDGKTAVTITRALSWPGICYRLVHVTEEGMETQVRGAGRLDSVDPRLYLPRETDVLRETTAIRGAAVDLHDRVSKVTVRIGHVKQDLPVTRGRLNNDFRGKLDLSKLDEGLYTLKIEATDGTKSWKTQRRYLALTGHREPFEAEADAELELEICGIDQGGQLFFNGRKLADLKPTKIKGNTDFKLPLQEPDILRFPIAKSHLRRLNSLEFRPDKISDDQLDVFCLADVRLSYLSKTYRDTYIPGGRHRPNYVLGPTFYNIDLRPAE